MTRSELIETMARAISRAEHTSCTWAGHDDMETLDPEGASDCFAAHATAALAALEARGLCIVPREATEAMREALWERMDLGPHYDQEYGLDERRAYMGDLWTAMIAASEGAK
jgi:hypothetical protein